ncbi:uncharacterized protein BP5553_05268 [Venustampulla echinocandica]|uniref:Uncharacterized protein n=1 Tax=Venustampulla echinocandica TaxID=2656787 RepID=A0A370TQM5_9HELO|nr:uncharacterized protein BP5553_05268 [Venustampulla echinocandica]RDL37835.1 hypothetical protein BP5553_05268 [Venustampulla echinocandica]
MTSSAKRTKRGTSPDRVTPCSTQVFVHVHLHFHPWKASHHHEIDRTTPTPPPPPLPPPPPPYHLPPQEQQRQYTTENPANVLPLAHSPRRSLPAVPIVTGLEFPYPA